VGASTSDFAKKFNVLWAKGLSSGDDQLKWFSRSQSESVLIVNSALNAPTIAGQNTRK
jgi:hypothetical protein